ncbi:uncharacterized protein [Watersipora subatra]|uniref:uncharacterized protein n=1 Tax=Watersipora subatra TaxID=2589382 RepID=UPI00355B2FA5
MAAQNSIGRMEPFDESIESFTCYLERFDFYTEANSIDDSKKKATFLSLIGPKLYKLLRGLAAPDRPTAKSFKELTTLLSNHISPPPLEIAETYRFHQRNQLPGESIHEYVAQLKLLAEHCNFEGAYRERVLRDRLVCGIYCENARRKLLTVADLNLSRAIEIARGMEQAGKDAEVMTQRQPTESKVCHISNMHSPTTSGKPWPCRSCGSTLHPRKQCPHLQAECFKCGRKGHLQSVCEQKTPSKRPQLQKPHRRAQNTHSVMSDAITEEHEDIAHINTLSKEHSHPPIMLDTLINGIPVKMELDTGAGVSTMPYHIYKKIKGSSELQPTSTTLKPYGATQSIKPKGVIYPTVHFSKQESKARMFVLDKSEGEQVPLFGREWLNHFKLNWSEIKANRVEATAQLMDTLVAKYPSLFKQTLGEMKKVEATLRTRPSAIPIRQKHRVVPFALRAKVEQELESLLNENVISPVEHSEWATPVVPVIKPNGSIRLCGDFKVTLNPQLVDQTRCSFKAFSYYHYT